MRVLFVHELFPPEVRGGGEIFVWQAAKAIQRRGADVRVLTTGYSDVTEYEGVPVKRLRIPRYGLNFASQAIEREAASVDLIQTFNYHACLPALRAGRRLGKPVSCFVVGLFGREWRNMKAFPMGYLWERFERYQLEADYDALFYVSDYSLDRARDLGIRSRRPRVLYPGVDQRRLTPLEKEDVVLFNGKFDRRKGVFEVLEVARALPEIPFWLYGWGPEDRAIRSQAPSNVTVIPYANNRADDLPNLAGRARICLLPSKAETFGYALVQAMACGCAVVSSIPLPFEGCAVQPTDVRAMIEAVQRLWLDREACAKAGQANAVLARQYTWDRFGAGLYATYTELVAGAQIAAESVQ